MASYKRKLKDASGNYVLPATRASCVYMYSSGNKTLDGEFNSLLEKVNGKASKLDCWPVGAIYMAVGGSSPSSMFGGSWTQIVGKFIRAKNSSQDSGSTGGNNNVTLSASNIPTLSTQILLSKGGYCAGGKIPQSFVKSSKDPSVVNNDLFADLNGQTCDRIVESSYSNSSLVRYYNSNQASVPTTPPFYACYIWRRTA